MIELGWIKTNWRRCVESLDALVYPWSCPLCGTGREGGSPFCPRCRGLIRAAADAEPACPRCALPTNAVVMPGRACERCAHRRSLGFDAATALGIYADEIRELCLLVKHERNSWLVRHLADLILFVRASKLAETPRDAWVVPVPLHANRRRRRGYNQAEELARGLATGLRLPCVSALRRVSDTPPLAELPRSTREKIMRNAFSARRSRGSGLKGRFVLLVDDILTTGSTCGAAARALKAAGAARVEVIVAGRAVEVQS